MWSDQVRVLDDGRDASWVRRRLPADDERPRVPAIGDVVPSGFASYTRLLHPVEHDGELATWADVARRIGRPLDALTRWSALAEGYDVGAPVAGSLPVEHLAALCDVLAARSGPDQECIFALWEGWPGWRTLEVPSLLLVAVPARPDVSGAPRVSFGGRAHVLVAAPLSAAIGMSYPDTPGQWWAQSPTAFWPTDRSWFVVTDPSRECTLIGGSIALREDLIAARGLECWPVRVTDRLEE